MAVIELGGGIELVDFPSADPNDLVVVKKFVGRFTKSMNSNFDDVQGVRLEFNKKSKAYSVKTEVMHGDGTLAGKGEDANLYFALDKSLNDCREQLT